MERQVFSTPNKAVQSQNIETNLSTQVRPLEYTVNYKNKTIQLMKRVTELEWKQNRMHYLEEEIQTINKQINNFFNTIGVSSFEQVANLLSDKLVQNIKETDQKSNFFQQQNEWGRLVQEYKAMINKQQYKLTNMDKTNKINEKKIFRMQEQYKHQEEQRKQLEVMMKKSKEDYRDILTENADLKEKLADLEQKYRSEIYHFEQMEKHVEEKLSEVEQEMNFYQKERENHLYKIQMYQKELQAKNTQAYFSFGGYKNEIIQTQPYQNLSNKPNQQEPYQPFNQSCYETSIKTLLEENQRLKNALILLHKCRKYQSLPEQVQLQLRILLNMNQFSD